MSVRIGCLCLLLLVVGTSVGALKCYASDGQNKKPTIEKCEKTTTHCLSLAGDSDKGRIQYKSCAKGDCAANVLMLKVLAMLGGQRNVNYVCCKGNLCNAGKA